MKAWIVCLEDEEIDTVFYDSDCDAQWVHDGLINHDGYNPAITIYCEDNGETYPPEEG